MREVGAQGLTKAPFGLKVNLTASGAPMSIGASVHGTPGDLFSQWWSRGRVSTSALHEQMKAIFFDVVEAKYFKPEGIGSLPEPE